MKKRILFMLALIFTLLGFAFGLIYFLDANHQNIFGLAQKDFVATSVVETLYSIPTLTPIPTRTRVPTPRPTPTATRKPAIRDSGCCGYPICPNEKPEIGASAWEARELCGQPTRINKTTTAYGTSEQWVYSSHTNSGEMYLYFDDGVLTAIQD